MKYFFAHLISILLGPVIWLPLLVLVLIFKSGLTKSQLIIIFPILLLFYVLIPLGIVLLLFISGKVKDLDLSNRKERFYPMLISIISMIAGTSTLFFIKNKTLFNYSIIILIIVIINSIITLKWKISFHAAVNMVGFLIINIFFNWRFIILILTLPLVFWARFVLKKHTISQLLAGFIVNGLLFIIMLKFLEILKI